MQTPFGFSILFSTLDTALNEAPALKEKLSLVKLLLAHGADPNSLETSLTPLQSTIIYTFDSRSYFHMDERLFRDFQEIITILLDGIPSDSDNTL
jgi:hypothetical protein